MCAKAFLHYRTKSDDQKLLIVQEDLPVNVQKGLLREKEMSDTISPLMDKKNLYLTFNPGKEEVVWAQDPTQSMAVYDSISHKLDHLNHENLSEIDLEELISNDVDRYFDTYVEELSHTNAYREIISDELWHLTNEIYELATEKLQRHFDEKVRFAFALHMNSTIERIRANQLIPHPNLNEIRRRYSTEFQLAIAISSQIEEAYHLMIPLDEIGFITMFLTQEISEKKMLTEKQVAVIVLMHGRSTASSMLETAQELLGIQNGIAFNMPLTVKTEEMYTQLRNYLAASKENFSEGIILLTDMGSLNDFGKLIYHETGIRAKVISLASTLVVLETLRLASLGRSLEDIYHSVKTMFVNLVQQEEFSEKDRKKVIIVACFTGEGVARKLHEVVSRLVDPDEFEIEQMQFLEKESFKHRIDQLIDHKEIVAIVGTMEISYQQIPFIPALDLFDRKKIIAFQDLLGTQITLNEMVKALTGDFSPSLNVAELFQTIELGLKRIREQQTLVIDPNVLQGIAIHLAFLVDKIKKGERSPAFIDCEYYLSQHQPLLNAIEQSLAPLQHKFEVIFTRDDQAYLVKMLHDNDIKL